MSLCAYTRHHQQKIVLFLAAMRAYADELKLEGYDVTYRPLDPADERSYEDKLKEALEAKRSSTLTCFEIEDREMSERIGRFADDFGLSLETLRSPMFLCSRAEFSRFAAGKHQLRMADFYKQQRRALNILIAPDGSPQGGRWSFDADNRKKLPRNIDPPPVAWVTPDGRTREVIEIVSSEFPGHPGDAQEFRWPTTRRAAEDWLEMFLNERLAAFGPYEDALSQRSASVFHSLLSPLMNLGLLTPAYVVERVLASMDDKPLQSIEGFIRQVIGWREFVRGVYHERGAQQASRIGSTASILSSPIRFSTY